MELSLPTDRNYYAECQCEQCQEFTRLHESHEYKERKAFEEYVGQAKIASKKKQKGGSQKGESIHYNLEKCFITGVNGDQSTTEISAVNSRAGSPEVDTNVSSMYGDDMEIRVLLEPLSATNGGLQSRTSRKNSPTSVHATPDKGLMERQST